MEKSKKEARTVLNRARLERLGRLYWKSRESNRKVAKAICSYVVERIFEGMVDPVEYTVDYRAEKRFWVFEYALHLGANYDFRHIHWFTEFQKKLLKMRTVFLKKHWTSYATGEIWNECQQYFGIFAGITEKDLIFAPTRYYVPGTDWDGATFNYVQFNIMLEYNNMYTTWMLQMAQNHMCCIGGQVDLLFLKRSESREYPQKHLNHCVGMPIVSRLPEKGVPVTFLDKEKVAALWRKNTYLRNMVAQYKVDKKILYERIDCLDDQTIRKESLTEAWTWKRDRFEKLLRSRFLRTEKYIECFKAKELELINGYSEKTRERKALEKTISYIAEDMNEYRRSTNTMRNKMEFYRTGLGKTRALNRELTQELELSREDKEIPLKFIQDKLDRRYSEREIAVALEEMTCSYKSLRMFSYKEIVKTIQPMLHAIDNEDPLKCKICNIQLLLPLSRHRTLICAHTFHRTCLETWFKENNKCAICEQRVQW